MRIASACRSTCKVSSTDTRSTPEEDREAVEDTEQRILAKKGDLETIPCADGMVAKGQ